MKLTTFAFSAVILTFTASAALAQTVQQHNAPGGPRDRVETLVRQQLGMPLPPPPPPPQPSTTTVTSPPASPR